MRVISGQAGGLKLRAVEGMTTRPVLDSIKEAVFNIIASRVPGARVLDLFAGAGSFGIEALSRRADFAVFVDKDRKSIDVIRDNLTHTKLGEYAQVLHSSFAVAIDILEGKREYFDIIFIDPPFGKGLIPEAVVHISRSHILRDNGIIIARSEVHDDAPEVIGRFRCVDRRKYGRSVVSFFGVQS